MLKELAPLFKKIERWMVHEKALDVILFGSAARGKMQPQDIDLCILISDTDEEKSIELVDSLGKITEKDVKTHITILTATALVKGNTLTRTLLSEGVSIKHKTDFSRRGGYEKKTLFVYSLKHFSASQRVRFHYLLRGRYGMRGILAEVEGKLMGTGTMAVPTEKEDILKEVFDQWKVPYTMHRVLWS
ncbi:MAG: nucleotidyltransferase domain-containing protein [Candidatus Woesearchaeota archaeon]|nr:nucleotidyltransferase domain-containing protein [Candidatus Woesearchaeota archaeon]